jgi:NlpC/P60 family putative phage cell wall peptidase
VSGVTGADVVAEALTWVGTPFRWQAAHKGVGADCKGFVAGVARALGLPEAEHLHMLKADYSPKVDSSFLARAIGEVLVPVETPAPGDVLLMLAAGLPQHLGIFAGERILHTYTGKWVAATRTGALLAKSPLHSAWRFGSLAA